MDTHRWYALIFKMRNFILHTLYQHYACGKVNGLGHYRCGHVLVYVGCREEGASSWFRAETSERTNGKWILNFDMLHFDELFKKINDRCVVL